MIRSLAREAMEAVAGTAVNRRRTQPVSGCGGSGGGGGLVDENECVVCMEVERSHMFSPCNHFCVCEACAGLIMASQTAECPKCRTKADRVGRIYA
jgi:hypothetical protein